MNSIPYRYSDLTQWLEHPITKLVMTTLIQRNEKERSQFIKNLKISDPEFVVERHLYHFAGQQQLIDKITDKERLRDQVLADVNWLKE